MTTPVYDSEFTGEQVDEAIRWARGVIEDTESVEIDLGTDSNSGDFSAGLIDVVRVGRVVTITAKTNLAHVVADSVLSGSGLLPPLMRPFAPEATAVYYTDFDTMYMVTVDASGAIGIKRFPLADFVMTPFSVSPPINITYLAE